MRDVGHRQGWRRGRSVLHLLVVGLLIGGVVAGCSRAGSPQGSPSTDPTVGSSADPSFGPDVGRADWWVAREDLPLAPGTRVIHGVLQERACASGSSPEGRILGPAIEYRADAVVVTFKVREIGGRCPSNPQFPITIELGEPLGTRGLFDGGVTPRRDATIDPTIVIEPEEDCGPLVGTGDTKVACITLVNATLGDRYAEFAKVRVEPEKDDCAGDACTELAAIEARMWIVTGIALDGTESTWTCAYREGVATCSRGTS